MFLDFLVSAQFEIMTHNIERVQRETLEAILPNNSGTEYLKKWGIFEGSRDPDPVQHFKLCVHVICYSDLAPYTENCIWGYFPHSNC